LKISESAASFGVGAKNTANGQNHSIFVRKPTKLKSLNLREYKELFFSPEVFKMFVDRSFDFINVIKSDVFSLGLVLLKVGLLESVNDIYSKSGLDAEKLSKKIAKLKKKYPENVLVMSTIEKMLEIDPENRPDFKQILDKLPEYNDIKAYFRQI
jgi:serine/threonine protein kinase